MIKKLKRGDFKITYVYRSLSTSDITQVLMSDNYASWQGDYKACKALAEYLQKLAEDTCESIELDIVALRCEYSLYDDLDDFNEQFTTEYESLDEVAEDYTVIRIPGGSFICDKN